MIILLGISRHGQRNIWKLLTSKIKSDESSALRFLIWDLKHLTLCGDKNKVVG